MKKLIVGMLFIVVLVVSTYSQTRDIYVIIVKNMYLSDSMYSYDFQGVNNLYNDVKEKYEQKFINYIQPTYSKLIEKRNSADTVDVVCGVAGGISLVAGIIVTALSSQTKTVLDTDPTSLTYKQSKTINYNDTTYLATGISLIGGGVLVGLGGIVLGELAIAPNETDIQQFINRFNQGSTVEKIKVK